MSVEDLVRTLMQEFRQIVKTETVVGEPVAVGETVLIPVSKISFGFGAGAGQGKGRGDDAGSSGTGGGASVEPIAFIVVRGGKAQLMPLKEKDASLRKLLELAPDVLQKLREFLEKRGDKSGKQKRQEPEGP